MQKLLKTVFWVPLFVPLYLLRGEFFGVPLNVLEVVILLFFALFAVIYGWRALSDFWQRRSKLDFFVEFMRRNRLLIWGGVAVFAMVLLSVAVVPGDLLLIDNETVFQSRRVAWGIVKGWIVIPALWFVMLYKLTETKYDLMSSVYAYLISCLPLCVWAIWQFATGDFITLDGRASGPFVNANYLAMYLAPAVIVWWRLVVREVVKGLVIGRFLLWLSGALLYSFVLILTQSYGALIGVFVALIFYLVMNFVLARKYDKRSELRMLKPLGYFVAVLSVIVAAASFLMFSGTEKWEMFTALSERSSSSVRLEVYEISWDFLQRNPLTGIGLGQFEAQYNLQAPEILGHAPYEWVMIHPHNTYLAFWLNLGVLGLAGFLTLVVLSFLSFMREEVLENKYFKLMGLSMLVVMLIHGMIDTYFFKNDLAVLFWLVIAICLLPSLQNKIKFNGSKLSQESAS